MVHISLAYRPPLNFLALYYDVIRWFGRAERLATAHLAAFHGLPPAATYIRAALSCLSTFCWRILMPLAAASALHCWLLLPPVAVGLRAGA